MKKGLISIMVFTVSMAYADCSTTPVGMDLAKSIEAKDVEKSKTLLAKYKEDVKKYLATCDQSKEKFEETSVMIHTYEARLKDVEHDLTKKDHGTDCNNVPNSDELDSAFESKKSEAIKAAYTAYKDAAANYIEHCASHAEYETVYESSMFYEEEYAGLGL